MKKIQILALLFSPLLLLGCSHPQPVAYQPPPPVITADQVARMGFHDGFEAARRDVAAGRPPAMRRHPKFRNPPVPPAAVVNYRQAFRRGYQRYLHPLPQNPPPPGI